MKIKRILASLLAVTAVEASMSAVPLNFQKISIIANAAETESYFEYETLEDGTIEITGCDTAVTKIEIPAEIDEKKVTSIGEGAFHGCSGLTSVTIPDSVTSIGKGVFYECSNLTAITIPDGVTSIGGWAFSRCSRLTSITIPNSVISIGNYAFYGTKWLKNKQKENPLVIVNGILIDGITCSGDVIIPDSVTSIEENAFYNCLSLTSMTITDSVTNIGGAAFYGCSGLTSITIPDSITSIEWSTFAGCTELTEITIPNSVTSIGYDAFSGCSGLTSITILNPDCEIYDKSKVSEIATIYGYENSTAQEYAEKYDYKFELIGESPATKVIAGDANCDGKVSIADATAILQHLGNQDKYGLSAEGLKNADVDEIDGVSTNDALVIQKVDANLLTVEQLPLKK